jgi:hypothetical protein
VIAVAAPERVVAKSPARSTERLTVIAAEIEEGSWVAWRQLLDAFPRSHHIFERFLVAVGVLILQFGKRTPNPRLPGSGHGGVLSDCRLPT